MFIYLLHVYIFFFNIYLYLTRSSLIIDKETKWNDTEDELTDE